MIYKTTRDKGLKERSAKCEASAWGKKTGKKETTMMMWAYNTTSSCFLPFFLFFLLLIVIKSKGVRRLITRFALSLCWSSPLREAPRYRPRRSVASFLRCADRQSVGASAVVPNSQVHQKAISRLRLAMVVFELMSLSRVYFHGFLFPAHCQ